MWLLVLHIVTTLVVRVKLLLSVLQKSPNTLKKKFRQNSAVTINRSIRDYAMFTCEVICVLLVKLSCVSMEAPSII